MKRRYHNKLFFVALFSYDVVLSGPGSYYDIIQVNTGIVEVIYFIKYISLCRFTIYMFHLSESHNAALLYQGGAIYPYLLLNRTHTSVNFQLYFSINMFSLTFRCQHERHSRLDMKVYRFV